jgi:hypothetical protein
MKRGGVLIDCWRLFAEDPPEAVAEYTALGCGPEAGVGPRVRIAAARYGD